MKESDELAERLERMWTWLDQHPDHERYSERETALLVELTRYVRVVDAERRRVAA